MLLSIHFHNCSCLHYCFSSVVYPLFKHQKELIIIYAHYLVIIFNITNYVTLVNMDISNNNWIFCRGVSSVTDTMNNTQIALSYNHIDINNVLQSDTLKYLQINGNRHMLIGSLSNFNFNFYTIHFKKGGWNYPILTSRGAYSPAYIITVHITSLLRGNHSHLSEVNHERAMYLAQGHTPSFSNVSTLKRETHYISLKILHQFGIELVQQLAANVVPHVYPHVDARKIAEKQDLFVLKNQHVMQASILLYKLSYYVIRKYWRWNVSRYLNLVNYCCCAKS